MKRIHGLALATLLVVFGPLGNRAVAGTLQTVLVSSTAPSPTTCSAPPATTSFTAGDATVYVYFLVQGLNSGDQASVHWINPSGSWAWTSTWNPVSSAGNWCFTGSILTSQLATAGDWRMEVYVNSGLLGQTSFTINGGSGGGGGSSGVNNTGAFDAVDCSHIFGWAKDLNHPNTFTSVNILVDGTLLSTVVAGDYRVDLANAGIGNHAFNFYGMPASLTNGQVHTVRLTYSGTSTDLSGSPKTFQNSCGSAPPSTVSTNWTTKPPTSMASGQSFSVAWQVSGPSSIVSRICWGTDTNTHSCQQQTTWQSGTTAHSVALTAPAVDLATYYFIIQAQVNGQDYWGNDVATSLVSGTSIGGTNQWTYNTDAYANPQNGWWARLVKTSVSGNRSTYTVYVLMSNGGSIRSASAAVITDLRVGMVRGSYSTKINRSLAILPLSVASGWEDPRNYSQADNLSNLAFDLWGFVNPEVDIANGIRSVFDDLISLSPANVHSSSWLLDKMLDENTYRVSRMGYSISSGVLGGLQTISGVSFSVTVDENSGLLPEFFVRAETKLGSVVGVEIGLDRKAVLSQSGPF